MKKLYFLLFFFGITVFAFDANAQCPTPGNTDITPCWDGGAGGSGSITFTFNDGTPPDGSTYTIRLYDYQADGGSGKFVYVSNNPDPSLNDVDAPTFNGNQLTFSNLPEGDYLLLLSNGGCGTSPGTFYGNGFTGGFTYNAIGLDQTLDIEISLDNVLPACAGNDGEIQITASGGEGTYSYSWTGPTVIGDTDNPTGLSAGIYEVTVTDGNGCTEVLGAIEIITPTVANAGSDDSICQDTYNLDGNSVQTGETGTWSLISQPGGANAQIDDVNDANTLITDLLFDGNYTFRWTISDNSGTCGNSDSDVTISVVSAPNAGVYVGTAGEVCTTDTNFNLTTLLDGSQDAGGSWADTDLSGATITGDLSDFTGVAAGTYQFTYTATGTAPCGDDTEIVEVNVSEAPNAGVYVGTAGEACNDGVFTLTDLLDGSQDAGGSWSDDDTSGAGISGNTADFSGIAAGTYDFTYTVTGAGSCLDATETVTVNVTQAANAGVYVGTAGEVCTTDTNFNLTTLLDGSQDAGGSWADTDLSGATITGDLSDFTGVAAGTYQFTYTATGTAPCGDDTEIVEVNVSEAPNAGVYVGTAGEACNDGVFTLTDLLDGSQDAGGSWSDDDTSGAGISGNTADFSGIAAGTYDFTYTVTGAGSCLDATETVTVNVTQAANAGVYVGTAGEVCTTDTNFNLTTLLDGSQDAGGSWADTDLSGATITGDLSDFTGVAAGTYQFTYTATGTAPCGDDTEIVEVNVSEAPNAGVYVGTAGEACNDGVFTLTDLLDGSQDAGGSWSDDDTSGAGISGNTADFSGIAAGTYDFTYTVTGAGSCLDATETVTVNVTQAANAGVYVGTAGEVCTTDTNFNLTTLLDGSQDAGGSWADTDLSGATITGDLSDFTGVAAGTYQFTYTATGTAPCGDDTEIVEVNVSEAPNAGVYVGTAGEACNDGVFTLTDLLDGSQDAGGSWSDDDTSGAGISGNTADFSGIAAGTYDFTYTVTGAGSCLDATETVTVNVTQAANAGVYVGTAGEVCTTDTNFNLTTLLDGSQDAGGSWADTDLSGATITGDLSDFTGVAAGTYQFTYTATGTAPCGDDTEIVEVNVSEAPNAGVYVGTAGEACNDGVFTLTDLLDGSQDAGGSWSDDDTSGAGISGNTADFSGIAAGTYDFTYTVTGAGSCLDATETVTVNVTQAANAGVYVGTAGEVCTTDTNFNLTTLLDGSQDAGGSWADTDLSGATITGDLSDFTGVAAGTYQFTYTATGTAPCGDDTEIVEVNVSEAPNAGVYVGTAGEACNDGVFTLTDLLDGSQDAGGSWSDDDTSGAGISGNTADFSGIAAGTYDFTYTVTGAGSCLDATETVTVNVTQAANAGVYVGTAGEVCTTDTNFNLTTLLDGSQDAGGSWADTDLSGATITGDLSDFTGVAAGTYQFTYTATGTAPCGDDTEIVEVNVSEAPNAGVYVGTAGEACNDGVFTLTDLLDGSQDAGGSWSDDDTSGAGISGNTADFSGIAAGTYDFTYTVTGAGSCLDATETVTVNVTQAANAGVYVGTAGEVCTTDTNFNLTTLLDGSQDAGGSWADTDLSGATITGDLSDFTGVAAGTYQFTYTATGTAPCGDDTEIVEVNVSEAPNAGVYVGTAGEACNDGVFTLTDLLDGSQDAGGSWSDDDTSGAGISGNTADFSGIAAGTYDFTYTVTGAGSCLDATETVTVNVTQAANAGVYVGTAGEVCTTDTNFNLTTLLDGSQDAGGSWADTDLSGATITGDLSDFTGVAAGTYQFTYTATGTAPCGDDTEIVEVNVSEAPNAGVYVGTAGEACNDGVFTLTDLLDGSQDAGGSWSDDDTSGAGISGNTADFSGIAAGTYDFTYTVTGAGSCLDATETVTVNVTQAANAGVYVGTAGEVCTTDTNFNLTTLLDGSQDAGGSWADTDLSGATITGDLSDFTGVAAGTYQFTYTATGTAPCGDDTEIVEVNVSEAPNAGVYVGTAGEACNDGVFTLTDLLDGSQDAGGSWSDDDTSGAGISGNTADFSGIAAGTYDFTYTVTGAGSCLDATETVTVNVTQAANAGVYVGTAGEVCTTDTNFNLTTLLDGSQDAGGSWADTDLSGATITGDLSDFTGVAAGTYQFTYTATGTAPCGDDTEIVEVNVSEAPNAGVYVGTAGEACNDGVFTLTDLLDGSQDAGGSWSDDDTSGAGISGNTADFSGIAAGTYDFTYTVTGAGSCLDATETVTVNVNSITATETITNTTGCGVPDGSIDITVTSSSAGDTFTFAWSGPSGFTASTEDVSGLGGGDYTVTVTSDNTSCQFIDTYTIADPVPFTIGITTTDQTQCGVDNGVVDVTVAAGTGPFNYYIEETSNPGVAVPGSISNGDASTTYNFSTLAPGDYEVFVEEGPCTQSETFTINSVSEITATIDSETPANCGGGVNGTIALSINDVGNDFDILVNGASEGVQTAGTNTYTITGLALGSYNIVVRDQVTNCEVNITEDINENASFSIDAEVKTDIATCGGNEGAVDLTISGGTPTIAWTGPNGFTAATEDISNLTDAGTYTVTLEETGCTVIRNYNITAPTPPIAVAGADSTICSPTLTLYADAAGAGETGAWTVISVPGGNIADVTFDDATSEAAIAAGFDLVGDYTLEWTVDNAATSCQDASQIVITRKDITVADAGIAQNVCIPEATMAANAPAAGESGLWEVVSGSANFADNTSAVTTVTGLTEGINELRWSISDDAGICTETVSTVIIDYTNLTVAAAGSSETICADAFTLAANAVKVDETGAWSIITEPTPGTAAFVDANNPTTEITNLVELGDYVLRWTVTDDNGNCTETFEEITITVVEPVSITTLDDSGVCVGDNFTTAASVSGGTTFEWTTSGDGTFDDATALGSIYTPGTDDIAAGTVDLSLQAFGLGSCPDVNATMTLTINSLTVADAGDSETICSDVFTLAGNAVSADETGTWSIISEPAAGTASFTDANLANTDITNMTALGDYVLRWTITDDLGICTETFEEITITVVEPVSITLLDNAVICAGDDFTTAATVTGGATFEWTTNGDGTFDDATAFGAIYTPGTNDSTAGSVDLSLQAFGQGLCPDDNATMTLAINTLAISANVTQPSGCGATDGAIDLTITNSLAGDALTINWMDQDGNAFTTEDISGLSAGTYMVQVTSDSSSCTIQETFEIIDPVPFSLTVDGTTNQSACDVNDGSISVSIAGSTANVNYYILDDQGNEVADTRIDDTADVTYSFSSLAPGNYEIVVEEGTCSALEAFVINPAPAITASIDPSNVTPASCGGGTDGSLTVDVTDVGNAFTAILTDGSGNTTEQNLAAGTTTVLFDALSQGTYSVTVTDDVTSCSVDLTQIINEDAPFTVDNFTITDIVNCGAAEGAIAIDASGFVGTPSFSWTGPGGFTADTEDISNLLVAGNYELTIIDGNCTFVQQYTLSQPSACDFNCDDLRIRPITEAASCLGVQDGQVFLFLSNVPATNSLNVFIKGSTAPEADYVAYTVNNPGSGLIVEIEDFFIAGTYNLVVQDAATECVSDTLNVNIGTKSNVTANVDISQPTCTVSTGSISVSLSGTADDFSYELYDAADLTSVLSSNTTGNFTEVTEGDYVIRFVNANSNGCGVADQNITIENTAIVDQSAVDINVTNPECGEIFGTISASLNNLPSNYEFILVDENGDEIARNATGIFNEVPEGTFVMQFENVVDPGACPIADRGGIVIENNGSFTAAASDVEGIVCHGDASGTAIITLQGISSGFYSFDNGVNWTEFTSGNRIIGLPEVNNLLVSNEAGTSDCELSIAVGIEYLSDPIELSGNGGQPQIVNEASCDESEADGIIQIPEITGGVEPYSFQIDGNTVELDGNRQITGLNKLAEIFTIIDDSGCSRDFEINNILAPNQIGASVVEINEDVNQCLLEPEGIQVTLRTFTVNNIPGPFTLILNRSDEEETVELPLNVDNNNGDSVFFVGPNYDLNYTFEKGRQYNWTIRTTNSEQSCSTDGTIRIDDGAVIPSFDVDFIDVACFNSNGFIELSNIVANNNFPLSIQVSKNGEIRETFTYNDFELNDSFIISTNELLSPENPNEPDGGTYNVVIYQQPEICNSLILSEEQSGIIEEPTSELRAELIPEPNLPPGTDRTRNDMNPVPTSRETTSDGSISIRLTSTTGSPNSLYYADLNLLEPIGNNSRADYTGILVDSVLFGSDEAITFEGLLPGIYEIVFYDEFGCEQNNKIIGQEGDFQITVDYDRRPFIPNVFTPNGDNKNDFFAILNLPDNGADLIVTNRNGTIVYRNDSYGPSDRETNLWDGGDSPDGIYFYQLTVNGTVQSGWVEILRGRR